MPGSARFAGCSRHRRYPDVLILYRARSPRAPVERKRAPKEPRGSRAWQPNAEPVAAAGCLATMRAAQTGADELLRNPT